VALFIQPNLLETAEIRSYLAGVAMCGQMEFFAQPDEWPGQTKQQASVVLPRNATLDERQFPILSTVPEHDLSFRRWGIDE
jgi:hypothetical protein